MDRVEGGNREAWEGHVRGHETGGHDTDEGAGQAPRQTMKFTVEELAVLKECNRESFWYRCVPLGVAFIATTQYLVSKGTLTPHPRYGALYKNFAAGLAAFVIGKMSYQTQCRQKIMRLENSPLAEKLRRENNWGELTRGPTINEGDSYGGETDRGAGYQSRMLESDGGHIEQRGLDDNMRPSVDSESYRHAVGERDKESSKLSYDTLRNRNRSEYERQLNKHPDRPTERKEEPGRSQSGRLPSDNGREGPVKRNKYGDIIES